MVRWNKALRCAVPSPMTIFNLSEYFVSGRLYYYKICVWRCLQFACPQIPTTNSPLSQTRFPAERHLDHRPWSWAIINIQVVRPSYLPSFLPTNLPSFLPSYLRRYAATKSSSKIRSKGSLKACVVLHKSVFYSRKISIARFIRKLAEAWTWKLHLREN